MIISSTVYLKSHRHITLPRNLISSLSEHSNATKAENFPTVLKLLECYCDITRTPFNYATLSRKRKLTNIVRGFTGALHSDDFVKARPSSRATWLRSLEKVLKSVQGQTPGMPNPTEILADVEGCKAAWKQISGDDHKNLDPEAMQYWSGWDLESGKGVISYLAIQEIWHSHGKDFAEKTYSAWKSFCVKGTAACNTEINRFLNHLSENHTAYPCAALEHPLEIKQLFIGWMREYFVNGALEQRNSLAPIWNRFISNIEEAYIHPGYWARPFTPLPRVPAKGAMAAAGFKLKTKDDGTEVQDQLLTEIPLQVTDSEAIEILFRKIKEDIELTRSWALAQASDLYMRAQRRVELASSNQTCAIRMGRKHNNIGVLLTDHCIAFEKNGMPASEEDLNKRHGVPSSTIDLAYMLGLPTVGSLFPYQCLLISEHPRIVPSSLINLELYDKKGNMSGFLTTDVGYQLVCYKDRRGPALSEIKVDLTPQSAQWVKEIIQITQPLRDLLKKNGDDNWRLLFLNCGAAFGKPKPSTRPWHPNTLRKSSKLRQVVMGQFSQHTSRSDEDLLQFIERLTLGRLRASCGVAVYLETKDVREMAKALGHAKYDPKLLAHYLPKALLAFLQSRWVRIFQRGIICLAMENSHYLLEATDFASMTELHAFLQNHALAEIPEHLVDPEGLSNRRRSDSTEACPEADCQHSKHQGSPNNAIKEQVDQAENQKTMKDPDQIFVAVGVGTLTALLSLEAAVNQAVHPAQVSGSARYWAEFAGYVTAEIERTNDGLLQQHLALARTHSDASRMDKIIYEAA